MSIAPTSLPDHPARRASQASGVHPRSRLAGAGPRAADQAPSALSPAPAPAPARRLRIGMIAPPWFELPPRGYGGTEAVVASLVDGLTDRGHDVTLVAAGEHRTRAARFHRIYPEPPTPLLGTPMPEVVAAAEAARALTEAEVDVVHDHTLAGPLLARGRRQPTVITMHGPVTGENGDYVARLGRTVDVVAISDAQRRLNPELNWVATVHNAVEVSSFPFREEKDDYVLWLGRFNPDKGAHLAIDAARTAGRRIVLAGKLNEPVEREYFETFIRPRLGEGVEYVGEADAVAKRELLAYARALAFPIQWEEPFGMVMIEAMACGTPVVAMRRGSVPEVVEDGRSGFVAEGFAEFVEALDRVDELDPATVRRQAEERFDVAAMAAGYERVYRMLVEGSSSIDRMTSPGRGARTRP